MAEENKDDFVGEKAAARFLEGNVPEPTHGYDTQNTGLELVNSGENEQVPFITEENQKQKQIPIGKRRRE